MTRRLRPCSSVSTRCGAIFDCTEKRDRIAEIDGELENPEIWNQPEQAQALGRERARLIADVGDANFFMLRNHGLLTIGPTVADAFLAMYLFEAACTVQIRALSGGGETIPIPQEILAGAKRMQQQVTHSQGAALVWPGLLRRLDRENPGYAD